MFTCASRYMLSKQDICLCHFVVQICNINCNKTFSDNGFYDTMKGAN